MSESFKITTNYGFNFREPEMMGTLTYSEPTVDPIIDLQTAGDILELTQTLIELLDEYGLWDSLWQLIN